MTNVSDKRTFRCGGEMVMKFGGGGRGRVRQGKVLTKVH